MKVLTLKKTLNAAAVAAAMVASVFLVTPKAHAFNVTIQGPSNTPNGPITLTGHQETAYAFCSLNWAGWQMINQWDHGRCLQSAVSYNLQGEANNPTEAGSFSDGRLWNPTLWSVPWYVYGSNNFFSSVVAPAYWMPSPEGLRTSETLIMKQVTIGFGGNPRLIRHDVTFRTQSFYPAWHAQFEILTGYMISNFSRFWTYDPGPMILAPLSDGPGEQSLPIIFSTQDGSMAIGIYSPDLSGGGYGRWRFNFGNPQNDTTKWNMVSRVSNPIPGHDYLYRTYYTVGSLADVQVALRQAWFLHNGG